MRALAVSLLPLAVFACQGEVTGLPSPGTDTGGGGASTSSGVGTPVSTSVGASGTSVGGLGSSAASSGGSGGAPSSGTASVGGVGDNGGAGGAVPACSPSSVETCYDGPAGTEGVGACKAGTKTCGEQGTLGPCTGQVLPSAEVCGNDTDEDCNGKLATGCAMCSAAPYEGITACTDGLDNDGDGLVDGWDPECLGPADRDEGSFPLQVHHEFESPCKYDCFFDSDIGSGNDHCWWNTKCDPKNPDPSECPYDPGYANCPATQAPECKAFCEPKAPNGCDCFGCCDFFLADGSSRTLLLGSNGCTSEDAALPTPQLCLPCTKSTSCENPCETCEYCIGKTTLPDGCSPPTSNGCSPGQAACTPEIPCPNGSHCLTGCCVGCLP